MLGLIFLGAIVAIAIALGCFLNWKQLAIATLGISISFWIYVWNLPSTGAAGSFLGLLAGALLIDLIFFLFAWGSWLIRMLIKNKKGESPS